MKVLQNQNKRIHFKFHKKCISCKLIIEYIKYIFRELKFIENKYISIRLFPTQLYIFKNYRNSTTEIIIFPMCAYI